MSTVQKKVFMQAWNVPPLLELVAGRGLDPADLMRKTGLLPEAAHDPRALASLDVMSATFDLAAELLGDQFLGVHVAQHARAGSYAIVELACRAAPTVHESLVRLAKYMPLLTSNTETTFAVKDGIGRLKLGVVGAPEAFGRHGNEMIAATWIRCFSAWTERKFTPRKVWFAHARPSDVSELAAFLGTNNLEFGAGTVGMEFDAETLAMPLQTSDLALLAVLDHHAAESLTLRSWLPDQAGGELAAIREAIRARLADGSPTVEQVAREVRLSPRALQRCLYNEGTSFKGQLDSVREEVAKLMVRQVDRSLIEIAFDLGYTELRTFCRSFKRWTGMSPGRFREQAFRGEGERVLRFPGRPVSSGDHFLSAVAG